MTIEASKGNDWAMTAVVAGTLVLAPLAYTFHLPSFLHAKEAVLVASLCALSLMAATAKADLRQGLLDYAPLWLWLAVASMRSVLYPPVVVADSLVEIIRWTLALLSVAFVYTTPRRPWLIHAFALSTVLVAALGVAQYCGMLPSLFPAFEGYTQKAYSVFGNQDLFGGYLAMGLAILASQAVIHRGKLPLVGVALVTLGLAISGSRSAWLAAAAGLCVVLYQARDSQTTKRAFGRTAAVMCAAGVMALVLASETTLGRISNTFSANDEGVQSRAVFYQAATLMFADSPVLGVGAGNYAYWSPLYIGKLIAQNAQPPAFNVERHADHPHSEFLRIAAETGVIGILCWVWFLTRIVRRARLCAPDNKVYGWGMMAAVGAFALFNGPFESVPHTLGLLLSAGLLLPQAQPQTNASPGLNRSVAVVALVVCGLEVWMVLLPSYTQRRADMSQLRGEDSIHHYQEAVALQWASAETHKNFAFALAGIGHDDEARREFLRALRGLDTGDIYLGLAILAAQAGDASEAHQWANECLKRWPGTHDAQSIVSQTSSVAGPE